MTLGKSHDLPGHGDYAILPYTCCRIAQSLEKHTMHTLPFGFLFDSRILECALIALLFSKVTRTTTAIF